MSVTSANRLELLQIAEAVAREKSIDRKIVIEAMEDAIQKAAKSRYGVENDIRCEIDPKTGEAKLTRVLAVVDEVENDATQIPLAAARLLGIRLKTPDAVPDEDAGRHIDTILATAPEDPELLLPAAGVAASLPSRKADAVTLYKSAEELYRDRGNEAKAAQVAALFAKLQ